MATVGTLSIKLVADAKGLDAGLSSAQRSLQNAGQSMKNLGKGMTLGLTAPLLAIGAAANKAGTELNRNMANVASLGVSTQRVNELRDSVQSLAIETGKSTTDVAQGLYQVISAFGDTADTANILAINVKAAAAGLATTEEAIALTSAVTKGYGDTNAEAVQHAADLAFVTVQLGQTTFPELAGSIGRVTPLAAALGVAMEEMFAVMATATGVTGSASEVSTQLRGILQSMMAPTGAMVKLYEQLGVAGGAALIEQLGLGGAIETIVAAAEKSGTPLQKYIGSIEGQTLALALAGPQAESYRQKLDAMTKAAGATDAAFQAQTQGVNAAGFAAQQASVKWQVFLQKLNEGLGPLKLAGIEALEPLADAALRMADAFATLDPKMQAWVVGALAATAAAGPLLVALGSIVAGASVLISPLGAVAVAIGAVGIAAYLYQVQVAAFASTLQDKLAPALDTLRGYQAEFMQILPALQSEATGMAQSGLGGIEQLQAQMESGFGAVRARVEQLALELQGAFDEGGWSGLYALGKDKVTGLADALAAGLVEMRQTAELGLAMAAIGFRIQANTALSEAGAFLDESGVRAWVERTVVQARQWAQDQFGQGTGAGDFVQRSVARVMGVVEDVQARMQQAKTGDAVERFNAAVTGVLDVLSLVHGIRTDAILTGAAALSKVTQAMLKFGAAVVESWNAEAIAGRLGETATMLAEGLTSAFEGADLAGLGDAAGAFAKALATKLGDTLGTAGFGEQIGGAIGKATAAIASGAQDFAGSFAAQLGATDWSQFGAELATFVRGFISGLMVATVDVAIQAVRESAQKTKGMSQTELAGYYAEQMGGQGFEIRGPGSDIEDAIVGFFANIIDWQALPGNIMAAAGMGEGFDLGGLFTEPEWVTELRTFKFTKPVWVTELQNFVTWGGMVIAETLAKAFTWPTLPKAFVEWAWPLASNGLSDLINWLWPLSGNGLSDLLNWGWPVSGGGLSDLLGWKWPFMPMPGWVESLLGFNPFAGGGGSGAGVGGGGGGGGGGFGPTFVYGHAMGVRNWAGGWSLVGEQGPELAYLPAGTDVFSNGESRRMLADTAPVTVNVNVASVNSELDMESLAWRVATLVQKRR